MKLSVIKFRTAVAGTLVAAACVMAPTAAHAETHYRPHISIGAHAGMAMGRMSFSPSVKQKWIDGVEFGVQARYAEEKIVGVVAELNLSQRGWAEQFDDQPELQYKRHLTYIDLPVMTHINFGSPRFRCFVNLGPQVSFMVGDKITSNFDYANPASADIPTTRRTAQMAMDVKNKIDYGITAALGAEFWVRPRHSVYLQARYYYGLGSIYGSSKADTFSASRCMALSVTLGYNFRLK